MPNVAESLYAFQLCSGERTIFQIRSMSSLNANVNDSHKHDSMRDESGTVRYTNTHAGTNVWSAA